MDAIADAVAALRARQPVILPTDTVYGLCSLPDERSVDALYRLKGREQRQPTALVAIDVDVLLECVPELEGRAAAIARELLPGAYTLVLPNPARRFAWLTGGGATIGVRVPELTGDAAAVLAEVRAVAATSANLPGGRDPKRLDDVPEQLRSGAGAVVDGGELPGTPSTVVDFTGPTANVLRVGGGDVGRVLAAAG